MEPYYAGAKVYAITTHLKACVLMPLRHSDRGLRKGGFGYLDLCLYSTREQHHDLNLGPGVEHSAIEFWSHIKILSLRPVGRKVLFNSSMKALLMFFFQGKSSWPTVVRFKNQLRSIRF